MHVDVTRNVAHYTSMRCVVRREEQTMSKFQIESKAGVVFGIYEGDTAQDAWGAMVAEAGGHAENIDGEPVEGAMADWIVTPVDGRYVIEGMGLLGWSRDHVESGGNATFATEADAEAAIDDLVRVCGWERAELRVREL